MTQRVDQVTLLHRRTPLDAHLGGTLAELVDRPVVVGVRLPPLRPTLEREVFEEALAILADFSLLLYWSRSFS